MLNLDFLSYLFRFGQQSLSSWQSRRRSGEIGREDRISFTIDCHDSQGSC